MATIKRAWQLLRSEGLVEVGARTAIRLLPPRPLALADVMGPGLKLTSRPEDCLAAMAATCGEAAPDPSSVAAWLNEFEEVLASPSPATQDIPESWDTGWNTRAVIYCTVRWRRPNVVLETGIARGASSLAILSALEENGHGWLTSVDVMRDVGGLVPGGLRHRWRTVQFDPRKARTEFKRLVADLGPIDMFFHDSDHNERWMAYEFSTVLPTISRGGVLCSDDVQLNRSFVNAVASTGEPVVLLDGSKASGFCIKTLSVA